MDVDPYDLFCDLAEPAGDADELTVSEAAELLRRDVQTVRAWVRSGRLPHRRVGATTLIDRAAAIAPASEPR